MFRSGRAAGGHIALIAHLAAALAPVSSKVRTIRLGGWRGEPQAGQTTEKPVEGGRVQPGHDDKTKRTRGVLATPNGSTASGGFKLARQVSGKAVLIGTAHIGPCH
jgi:hypothetical protein